MFVQNLDNFAATICKVFTWINFKSFSCLEKCLFLIISSLLCVSHFGRETTNENKQFKETKTLISNIQFDHTEVSSVPCKSGIVSFAWRVAYNCIPSHVEENKPCTCLKIDYSIFTTVRTRKLWNMKTNFQQ